jgi:BirA family biotin operon repressor/biotin-[acetyl-CoA-carboxylase] ligase
VTAAGAPRFDAALLERGLGARRRLAQVIEVVDACASTNDRMRAALAGGVASTTVGRLLVADEQVAGRGRKARDWWSGPPRANLACTLLVPDPPRPALLLALAGACALAEAVTPLVDAPVALKWPNDLLVGGAKTAGLLGEVPAEGRGAALLGLGVNVGAAPPADALPYTSTCLADAAPPDAPALRRETLLAAWLLGLERRLTRLEAGGPAELEAECLARLRDWAPRGVRAGDVAGPLLEFTVSGGLAWGAEGAVERRPLGQVPTLEAL